MGISSLTLDGTEYQFSINIPPICKQYKGRSLSEYSWSQLKTKCKNNDFSDIAVGDYKTITLSDNQKLDMVIMGIDTYYGTYGQTKHHIDWISQQALKDKIPWNTTLDNNGTSTNKCPWLASNLKSKLNSTIYNKLPSEVRNVIVVKGSFLEERYSSSGKLSQSTASVWKSDIGKIWIPSEYEVFGSVIRGTPKYSQGMCVQYPLFANSWMHRARRYSDLFEHDFYLLTVSGEYPDYICSVYVAGQCAAVDFAYDESDSWYPYTVICFRIAG